MSTHNISFADTLYRGSAYNPGANSGKAGVQINPLTLIDLGTPAAAGTTDVVNAKGLTNNALDVGVSTDVPRSLVIEASAANTANVTIYGNDQYGAPMTETLTLNGTTSVAGAKAFGYVDHVTADATVTGTISIGYGSQLGLPYRCDGAYAMLHGYVGSTAELPTLTAADTATATDTTGDTRGTVSFTTVPDGSNQYRLWIHVEHISGREGPYGVGQA